MENEPYIYIWRKANEFYRDETAFLFSSYWELNEIKTEREKLCRKDEENMKKISRALMAKPLPEKVKFYKGLPHGPYKDLYRPFLVAKG